jgi:hypothetical protein
LRIPLNIRAYAPDLSPQTPGIILDCSAILPALHGIKAAPAFSDVGLDALAAACQGAAVVRKLDASTRFFAGSATKLYENVSGATWTDRTRASGGNYGLGEANRWRFAQYGDTTLAAAKTDTLQSSSSGAFADVTGAPKASIVETVGQFAMCFDTNEATYGDSPDRWFGSAIGDVTGWTPAVATQCATGRLTSTSGPIRAGRRLGESIVAYKDRAMFLGRYVGGDLIWDWQEVSDAVGAPCQEVVVPVTTRSGGYAHIFLGYDDFYYYDGSRPIPIPNPVKRTIFQDIDKSYLYKSHALHDRINSLIYFYYSSSGGTIDSCVVYNYRKDDWLDSWGRDDRTIEATVEYVTAGPTYDDLGTLYATYDTSIPFSYDSPYWVSGYPVPAVFNSSHDVGSLTGTPGTTSFTLSDLGDDSQFSTISRVRPRYQSTPSSASLANAYKNLSGSSLTNDTTTSIDNGKFDVLRSARWHRLTHSSSGNMELPHQASMVVELEMDGDE